MDFLNFAKEIETQGMELYSVLAHKTEIRELKGIFAFMAAQEKSHYELFDAWQKKGEAPTLPRETVVSRAKDVFKQIADHFSDQKFLPPINYEQAYDQALLFEKKSVALYEESLPKVTDIGKQVMLKLIIDQEKAHESFISSLMEFQHHPGEWLENAEWRHMDEY
ncbi:MAG: ferritin family protein [Chitinispirillaceae bacterium]|jgi:rubrerythrin